VRYLTVFVDDGAEADLIVGLDVLATGHVDGVRIPDYEAMALRLLKRAAPKVRIMDGGPVPTRRRQDDLSTQKGARV
jgi:hypothetical protein